MKLNLGSGGHRLPGFHNLDKVDGWTFENGLGDYADGSVEGVTISHAAMFLPREKWPALFAEIARVLAPGGVLRVTEDATDARGTERFGGHADAVTLTSADLVARHMERAGLTAFVVAPTETRFRDDSLIQNVHGGAPKCFFVEGVKGGTKPARARRPPQPVRISVVVPSIGRDSLGRALRSAQDADEVLVEFNADGDRGYAARERAIARAKGTHLCFLDDDDLYAPGALGLFREAAAQNPGKVTIFRMKHSHGDVLWKTPWLAFGNVGTPMLLVPNVPDRLGKWEPHPGGNTGGDYVFAAGCCERMGEPVFREEVVALIRPT